MALEKPKINIKNISVIIDDKEIHDGDTIVFIHNGKIKRQGTVRFGIYSDGEGFYDEWHLGFYVEWKDDVRWTLADAIAIAQEKGWSWYIIKNGE